MNSRPIKLFATCLVLDMLVIGQSVTTHADDFARTMDEQTARDRQRLHAAELGLPKISIGATTGDEVVAWFGPPSWTTDHGRMGPAFAQLQYPFPGSGERALVYEYYIPNAPDEMPPDGTQGVFFTIIATVDTTTQRVVLFRAGAHEVNVRSDDVQAGFERVQRLRQRLHDVNARYNAAKKMLSTTEANKTTEQQIVERLGEPDWWMTADGHHGGLEPSLGKDLEYRHIVSTPPREHRKLLVYSVHQRDPSNLNSLGVYWGAGRDLILVFTINTVTGRVETVEPHELFWMS